MALPMPALAQSDQTYQFDLQAQDLGDALRSIAAEQGVAGLYKGWAVTSARAAVLTSAQIGTYDSVKRNIMMDVFGLEDGFALHLGSSMVAGLVTTTATNPCTSPPLCPVSCAEA